MAIVAFDDCYRDKKVLVTGHTGFKGSWLTLWLTELGADVIGYSKGVPTKPSHHELLKLPITNLTGEITDAAALGGAIKKYRPEIVFHLAAQALVRDSYQQPLETIQTNVLGTTTVLEACRQSETVRAIVNITSDKCYRNVEQLWGYRETDPMGGHDPYSASKGAAELISQAYRTAFFGPNAERPILLANARAGNVIGGGDWAKDRLIPDVMRAAAAKKTTVVRSPDAVRPWQHVLEPLSGYLLLGTRLLNGEAAAADDWNFGPADEAALSVRQVISQLRRHWPAVHFDIQADPNQPHEANVLRLDSTKAHLKLGWQSVWTSEQAISRTVQWYKRYAAGQPIQSRADLNDYLTDATLAGASWLKN